MNDFNENEVLLTIQQLIDKYRCSIDGFFTDSKTAAVDILKYLKSQNIITKNKEIFPLEFKEQSKAA